MKITFKHQFLQNLEIVPILATIMKNVKIDFQSHKESVKKGCEKLNHFCLSELTS